MDFVLQNLFLDNIAQTTHFSLEFALNRISLFIIFRVLGFKFCRNTVKNVNFSLRIKQLFECILNGCVQFSKYCQFTVDSAYYLKRIKKRCFVLGIFLPSYIRIKRRIAV